MTGSHSSPKSCLEGRTQAEGVIAAWPAQPYKGPYEVIMFVRTIISSASLGLLMLASVIGVAHAQKDNERPPPPPETVVPQRILKVFPFDTTWTAVRINGKDIDRAHRPAFILDKQFRGRGFSGCNTFSATTYAMQERIAVGPIATTKVNCEKALNDLERSFLVTLRTSQVWELKEGRLIIKGPNGELIFERSM
jgi:heat shock protein HslJ